MKYYAVIDTNVLVSALLKWESIPGAVAIESLVGKITPILNDEILAEYRDVLSRPKFVPDPKDIVFYQVVMEVRKTNDAYLVTGNLRHFPVKTFVVTPREMMEIIRTNET
ncbi:MAG TPA: toxin PIN [Clostridiales bacterium]|nr:toxin PIN [Clostridiales bacterium]